MKEHSDQLSKAKYKDINIQDKVLVKQTVRSKMCPIYDPTPYQIIQNTGNMVTA